LWFVSVQIPWDIVVSSRAKMKINKCILQCVDKAYESRKEVFEREGGSEEIESGTRW
jgi:hypothetical protein